ncbi:hypothetical protein FOPE_12330 [Fonsecaea pedrosoi]|nr:hypothetical protein FOPE_12330 [Fonsecaea pedrosoi]
MISLLLDHEADPEDTNVSDLEDPPSCSLFKFLVRKGRNPSIAGGSYGNLLNCAVATASVSILEDIMVVCDGKELSVKNADVEVKLASHFAATGANQRAFELALLPDLGAKDKQGGRSFVDDKTAEGYTAEDIAILHQKTHFIPYLRSNNDDVSVADVDEDELSRLAKKVREVSAGACVSYFCLINGTSHHCTTCPDVYLCCKRYRHLKDIHDPSHTFERQGGIGSLDSDQVA